MRIWVQLLGPTPVKFWRVKTFKIWRNFGQLQILIAHICSVDNAIDKMKMALSTTIHLAFDGKNLVNFDPLTTVFTRLMFTLQK